MNIHTLLDKKDIAQSHKTSEKKFYRIQLFSFIKWQWLFYTLFVGTQIIKCHSINVVSVHTSISR